MYRLIYCGWLLRVSRDGPWSVYHCVCSTCARGRSLVRLPLCLQHVCQGKVLVPFTTVSAARVPRDGPWSVYHCVCSMCAKGWFLVRLPLCLQHVRQGMVLGSFTTVSAARVPRDGPWSIYHCVCSTCAKGWSLKFNEQIIYLTIYYIYLINLFIVLMYT